MIRKKHGHTLQTNIRHREEVPHSSESHKTPGRQLKKATNSLFPANVIVHVTLEGHKVLNNQIRTKHRTSTKMGATINNESSTVAAEPAP